MFDGVKNLFSGVRNLFSGSQPSAPPRIPDSVFTGEPSGMGSMVPIAPGQAAPQFIIGTNRPLQDPQTGQEIPSSQPGLAHVYTFASLWNTTAKTYSWRWDEAYRKSRTDALAMRRDCFLQGLLFERKFPSAQTAYHVEPDDKKDPVQVEAAEYVQACIETLPNVTELMMQCLEALWYGRSGVQLVWDYKQVMGRRSFIPVSFQPVNGDKIQFEWDGTPQVRIYGGMTKDMLHEDVVQTDPDGPGNTVYTDRGMMLRLKRPYWRDRFIVHKHDCIDADFYESDMAGGVHGVGIRHWIYWFDWIKKEIASYIMDFLERTGTGFTVYYYDPGNPQELANVKQIAKQQGRNTWIVWPRAPGETSAQKGVERIEPSTAGATVLKDLLSYYDGYIERFIVGQTMSSGRDNESGLGGTGRANFAKQTKAFILKNDTLRLAGTLSSDLAMPIFRYNRPDLFGKFSLRWKPSLDDADPEAKLAAGQTLFNMGVDLKTDELRQVGGYSKPAPDDEIVSITQLQQAQQAMQQPPMPPGQDGQQAGNLFQGQPAPAQPAEQSPAAGTEPEQEEEPRRPVRYAKESPMRLNLYVYRGKGESDAIPLGEHDRWEAFARWAAGQGGELERLAREGHTDAYRPVDSLTGLDEQLVKSKVPEQYHAIADLIRDAIRDHADVEGIVVSGEEDDA